MTKKIVIASDRRERGNLVMSAEYSQRQLYEIPSLRSGRLGWIALLRSH
jgi:hypothetical protein